MSPAERLERALRATQRTTLLAYLTGGYPDPERFPETLRAIARVADAVEIGIPFSDPMADGVTIQRASEQALAAGATLGGILDTLEALALPIPVVLMSYLNPLLTMGPARLASRAAAAGVSGFVVPDLPFEERDLLARHLEPAGLALIQLVTPLTPPDRLARIAGASRGFVYAVTTTGTTGREVTTHDTLTDYLDRVMVASRAPVMAGFGIRRAAQVRALAGHTDGVIVGSAVIDAVARGEDPAIFLRGLRAPEGVPCGA